MRKRIEVILNPIAGAGAAQGLVDGLVRRLRRRGQMVGVFRTEQSGDARRQARLLSEQRVDAILVAGGDGTISEVIDGVLGSDSPDGEAPPLAILPVGTENLLAKVLKAKANIALAEATLLGGQVRQFDVAAIDRPDSAVEGWNAGEGPACAPAHFLMVAGAGFDAEVVHRLASRRSGNITYIDYFQPLLRTLISYGYPAVRVEADGEVVCEEPALVFVGNIPRYALGLPICKRARIDDGLLDLVVFKCAHFGQLVMHSVRTVLHRHLQHPRVISRQVRSVVVRAREPVMLEVDGDRCGQLPVRFFMPGRHVRLLAPPGR